jgi:uncharacterized membrane protein
MPPPPPPGSGATPVTGIDKKTGSFLAYLVQWITGVIFLFVGKGDPDIKYHAAQSVVFFGSLSVLGIVIRIVASFPSLSPVNWIGTLLSLYGTIMWIYCMYKAWTGGGARFQIPIVGGVVTPYAEQLANAV